MSNNYLVIGSGNPEFGTDGVGYTAIGVITGAERDDSGDKLELKDRQGNVIAVIYYNDKNECSIDVIFDADATLPVRGDAINVCGLTGVLVDSLTHKWENEKNRMLSIKGTRYANLTLS